MGRIHSQPVSVHSKKRRKDTKGSRTVLFTERTNYIRILSPLWAGIKQGMEPGILWKLWRAHNMAQYKRKRLWRYPIKLHRCNKKEGDIMFDKFGEFDSAGELNKAAAGLLAKGETKNIFILAEENGIDRGDAQDYIDCVVPELTTPLMAALGKIKIEKAELRLEGILGDWYEMVADECMNVPDMAAAVRKKGKALAEFMSKLLAKAFHDKVQVSDKIISITMIERNGKKEKMRGPVYLGIPSRAEVRKLMREYYLS